MQNRKHEQIVDSPVPQIMEVGVQVSSSSPQECVQNRTQERVPVPDRGADRRCAGASVQEEHRGDDSTCASGVPMSHGAFWVCASAQDQGGCRGRKTRGTHRSRGKGGSSWTWQEDPLNS